MTQLVREITDSVIAAISAGTAEAAEALGRTLGTTLQISAPQTLEISSESLPAELSAAGLAVVLQVDDAAAVVTVSSSGGILPDWCAAPDATGASKLATLAQELGMLLLPEALMPADFQTGWVSNLADSLRRGKLDPSGGCLAMSLSAGDSKTAVMHLFWPIPAHKEVLSEPPAPEAAVDSPQVQEEAPAAQKEEPVASEPISPAPPAAVPQVAAAQAVGKPPIPPAVSAAEEVALETLPIYTRSLLKIKVSVVVNLAKRKQPIAKIIRLSPGSILQFDKSCEEHLEIEVGGELIARGEAVKVGDKFGVRVVSIIMPSERFMPVSKSLARIA